MDLTSYHESKAPRWGGKVRFYLYVSESKVDMLFAQIPQKIQDRIATELKIDLKVVSATFREKERASSLYARCEIVVNYLEDNEIIGSVDEPAAYFGGSLPVRWAIFRDERTDPVVYFGGETAYTVCGLGGSARHIVGAIPSGVSTQNMFAISGSSLPGLLPLIYSAENQITSIPAVNEPEGEDEILAFTKALTGPLQRINFLARRLLYVRARDGKNALLGTPIYVALSDL
jgi:hypothetical protein